MKSAFLRSLLPALCLLFLPACSSLLYFPTHELHYPPNRFSLSPEEVHLQSADGTKLFAWLFRHTAPEGTKPKALLVFYHGNGENLSSHYVSLIWILKQGYDFLIFDYRGYGRSEGEPDPQGTVQDGEAALRWARAHYPQTPIVIYGQSLGGNIALRNAIDLKDEIGLRAVAADSTFASYQEVGRKVLARNIVTWPFQWLPWLVLSDRYAPERDLGRLAPVPLLVMHAEGDETVPFSCGERLYAEASPPKDFWKIPGNGHASTFMLSGPVYQQKFLEWLEHVLGPRR
jgi:uncharacterized protein